MCITAIVEKDTIKLPVHVPDASQSDNGNIRTVIDPNATVVKKFYRVQVSKP